MQITGIISWVHNILCPVSVDDCWFKGYDLEDLFFGHFLCRKLKRKEEITNPLSLPRAVLYRWQQTIPPNMALVKKLLVFINVAYTILVLNYSAVGFMVSTFSYWSKLFQKLKIDISGA
jgi:hypothetical protein